MSELVTRRQVLKGGVAAGVSAAAAAAIVPGAALADPTPASRSTNGRPVTGTPYQPSKLVKNIEWDWTNRLRFAHGSDLWPATVAADGSLYTAWGDGGGFGGTNDAGRSSLGFGRITDSPADLVLYDDYGGTNVWGGLDGENPAQFTGKCPGLVSVDGLLYAFINLEDYGATAATWSHQLAYSTDLSATWQKAPVVFPGVVGGFAAETFLQYGPGYAGGPSDYVYVYGPIWGNANVISTMKHLYLMRMPRGQMLDSSGYEFLSRLDARNNPSWSPNVADAAPVYTDPQGGLDIGQVMYNSALSRYILTAPHKFLQGSLGIFESPTPWGPWRTIAYYEDWAGITGLPDLECQFPTSWVSSDGTEMWLIYSTTGPYDSLNVVQATLSLA